MKVLFLVQDEQRVLLDELYASVARHCDCDLRRLSPDEQKNLRGYFRTQVTASHYDRILLILRSKKVMRQTRFLRTLPNLVFLEHDAWQNYIPGNKYQGRFSQLYHKLPWARIISSGFDISERLQKEGFDCRFVAKGYDQTLIHDVGRDRDIEYGFIGSTKNSIYTERKAFLEQLERDNDLKIMQTASGNDYVKALNRIRFFISADINFGEYMIKNFEAMAAGCILCAWNQGETENHALGFKDMEHLVLYRSIAELLEKLERLKQEPQLAERIRAAGKLLVTEQYTFAQLGQRIVEALEPPLHAPTSSKRWFWSKKCPA